MLTVWAKNTFFGKNPSATEFSTSSLHACKQRGASDWKTLRSWNVWEDRSFTNFSKVAFSKKVTTVFENRAKRQAEAKTCAFFYMDHKAIPILQPQNSILFAHFRFECKQLKISITRYSWKRNHSKKCYQKPLLMIQKNWKLWNYRLVVLSTELHEEMHWRFPIACNRYYNAFRTLTFVPLCRFHFWSDCNEISYAFEP